jgi:hypothetical protein
MHALGVAIVGENGVEMAYYPEVAAVLGSARLLPKTSVTRAKAVTRPALNVASEMRTTYRGCGSNACRSFRSRETNVLSRPRKRLTSVT